MINYKKYFWLVIACIHCGGPSHFWYSNFMEWNNKVNRENNRSTCVQMQVGLNDLIAKRWLLGLYNKLSFTNVHACAIKEILYPKVHDYYPTRDNTAELYVTTGIQNFIEKHKFPGLMDVLVQFAAMKICKELKDLSALAVEYKIKAVALKESEKVFQLINIPFLGPDTMIFIFAARIIGREIVDADKRKEAAFTFITEAGLDIIEFQPLIEEQYFLDRAIEAYRRIESAEGRESVLSELIEEYPEIAKKYCADLASKEEGLKKVIVDKLKRIEYEEVLHHIERINEISVHNIAKRQIKELQGLRGAIYQESVNKVLQALLDFVQKKECRYCMEPELVINDEIKRFIEVADMCDVDNSAIIENALAIGDRVVQPYLLKKFHKSSYTSPGEMQFKRLELLHGVCISRDLYLKMMEIIKQRYEEEVEEYKDKKRQELTGSPLCKALKQMEEFKLEELSKFLQR